MYMYMHEANRIVQCILSDTSIHDTRAVYIYTYIYTIYIYTYIYTYIKIYLYVPL